MMMKSDFRLGDILLRRRQDDDGAPRPSHPSISEGSRIVSAMYSERMKDHFKGLPFFEDKLLPKAVLTAEFNTISGNITGGKKEYRRLERL